jgi:nitrate reductase beta subunit
VSGCPYKKVYFNHRTGKAEKCTFCFPRIEAGQPTICSETCVGRLRYLGVLLYDADAVAAAASVPDERDLYQAQLAVFCDPHDPAIVTEAHRQGIPHDWIQAAQRSPIYELTMRHRVALPLHPEYRTLPMVWYIPPLSPVTDIVDAAGYADDDPDRVFAAIEDLRIPLGYLANLFTVGDVEQIQQVLRRLAVMRAHMRARQLGDDPDPALAAGVGMDIGDVEDLYRLLAIAKYEDRYVIPQTHQEDTGRLMNQHCSLGYPGGSSDYGAHTEDTLAEHFHLTAQPGQVPRGATHASGSQFRDDQGRMRFNLLGWNGTDPAPGLFGEAGSS